MSKFLLRSFAGGEITPELAGRIELTKYQTALALARNVVTLPHGPATRRPGLRFVTEAKDSTHPVRLIPFAYSATATVVLEFGHYYVRFHSNGATALEASIAITSISGGLVNTATAHGYSTYDWVYIGGRVHRVFATSPGNFSTIDLWGNASVASGTSVARVYTLESPYSSADLADLHYAQSADVLTLTHPNYPVYELTRLAATSWTLTIPNFAPPSAAPDGVSATATVAVSTNLTQAKYVVTAVQSDGVTESMPSASASATNNLTLAGNFNTLTWNAVDGAARYNVYKLRGGAYGYIGQVSAQAGTTKAIATIFRNFPIGDSKKVYVTTTAAHGFTTGDRVFITGTGASSLDGVWSVTVTSSTQFNYTSASRSTQYKTTGTASIPSLQLVDDNVLPDTTRTPPEDIITLNAGSNDYPTTVTYHEQRRWFAGTNDKPQVLWATRTGTDANLTSSIPTREADAMEIKIASLQNNQIRHLVPLSDLIAFTAGGEWRLYADGVPAITPTSISIKPQGYSGSNNVMPVVTSGSILYVQAQGSRVREIAYNWESNAYKSIDITIMAPHRFNGFTLTDLAYSRAPEQMLWAVRNDGTLLGLTYVPEQQVYGWHAHDTSGYFESVTVVAENNEDALYAVVRRTIAGRTVRYVERLNTRIFSDQEDAFYVDSGLTYDGSPVSSLSGLYHLEGQQVSILADGAVHPVRTVTGGAITLDYAASVIQVGLAYTSDIRTLPLAIEGAQAAGQGTMKNVNKVHLRVTQSSLVKAGPSFDKLREYPARAVTDPYGSAPALRTGEISLGVDPSWNTDAAICVRQTDPLPLTILSMTLEVAVGG